MGTEEKRTVNRIKVIDLDKCFKDIFALEIINGLRYDQVDILSAVLADFERLAKAADNTHDVECIRPEALLASHIYSETVIDAVKRVRSNMQDPAFRKKVNDAYTKARPMAAVWEQKVRTKLAVDGKVTLSDAGRFLADAVRETGIGDMQIKLSPRTLKWLELLTTVLLFALLRGLSLDNEQPKRED